MQFPVGDYKTPAGVALEGRGVIPDVSAKLTRSDLLAGRDVAIEAALRLIKKDPPSIPFKQKTPDYTGVWELDIEKSKLDERSRLEGATMTIDQTEKDITIKKKTRLKEGAGNSLSLSTKDKDGEKCSFDGTEVVREIEHSMATGSITTKCGFREAGRLEITKSSLIFIQGQSINTKMVDVWEISNDGKTLTINSKSENPSRTVENKMVFIRKDNVDNRK